VGLFWFGTLLGPEATAVPLLPSGRVGVVVFGAGSPLGIHIASQLAVVAGGVVVGGCWWVFEI
jgi:hypothetical protein